MTLCEEVLRAQVRFEVRTVRQRMAIRWAHCDDSLLQIGVTTEADASRDIRSTSLGSSRTPEGR